MSSSSGGSLGSGGKKPGGIPYFIGRVKSIVLNPYLDGTKTPNPDYQSPADYGKIRFEKVYGDITQTRLANENDFAYPMFSFVKQLPLINEIVAVFYGPSPELNDYKENQRKFYMPAYALWGSMNHNVMPSIAEMAQFYNSYSTKPNYQGGTGTPPEFPKGDTFTELDNIRTLTPFEGDSILEGRFGQSIRFGSTVPKFKGFNSWSNSGNNGSPITIIRNGQGQVSDPVNKFSTTVEDINTDAASIYLTKDQSIILDDIDNFPMNSYGKSVASTNVSTTTLIFQKPLSNDYASANDQDKYTFNIS